MSIIEVTSREFRQKLRSFFDLADKGEKVVVKRGRKSYLITPVETGDIEISADLEKRINKAMVQVQQGETVRIKNEEELAAYLESL